MDLRLTFNEDESNYDKWRPTYVNELFDEIIRYSCISETKQALEIGIGTGQATLPILETKCKLTAIEIGENLTEYSKVKFVSFNNFEVVNIDFESFCAESNTFDLIYSATAFHWIPEEVSYTKVFDLLKSGGVLALFWNHPFVSRTDDLLHLKIQKIYNEFRPSDKNRIEFDKSDCIKIVEIINQYGFKNCYSKLFFQTRTFTADGYISLLNTYSDHRALPKDVKTGLENGIAAAIKSFGGILHIYDTMDLYLAQKP
ncbi:class I SAM-dependent methyltransferase [Clostridium bowmanii]|uniref:class I SAM-dependent methyltransferase n=1 Tax=Clostridium bowmanii TaxID=132925 RepID=UPI001C0C2DCF|nr:class I SAM-dependent methyltransferase [Clostridium bowmanii]MBU3192333.1 class I SAM-dependent methyltransferase [Clostridium bowmanii]MCA1076538.1 class I SAM-dependent methyltransferase [Clostridium bowmanii]